MPLSSALPSAEQIAEQVRLAIAEDLGSGDLTAGLIPEATLARAQVICRESAVLAGQAWFDEVFRQIEPTSKVIWSLVDGAVMSPDQRVCEVHGSARAMLSAERTALNFLQTLSGTATQAAHYVRAVAGTGVRILDTRKTLPGLRLAQKYAVTCGGASNHRVGLYDAILIKENHIAAAGSISGALHMAQAGAEVEIEIEVENLSQLEEAIAAGAKRVLLDNFELDDLRKAVAMAKGKVRLEASGGIDQNTILAVAQTGVDDISVGPITKHLHAVDFSMRFV